MDTAVKPKLRPNITNRGNYHCPYCTKYWKRTGPYIEEHIKSHHLAEALAAGAEDKVTAIARKEALEKSKLERVERDNVELRRQLTEALKAPPKPPEKKTEYYQCVLYCKNENKVIKAGMPKGVLVENVTCSGCGVRGALVITNNDPNWVI